MGIKINVEGFKALCQAEKFDLLTWLTRQLSEYYGKNNVVAPGDYLFCAGNIPMMLCAHVDTVFHEQPSEFFYDEVKRTISSPQGIGGDDRCGVYSILAILKELGEGKRPYLFFSTDEEVGGASTKKAAVEVKSRIAGVNYLIELDRQGEKDSVYYRCGNTKFKKWIDSFGFVEAQGTNTDICTLCKEWDLAGVNFSVGYFDNHRVVEHVDFSMLESTIEKVLDIIKSTDGETLYTFCEKGYGYSSGTYGGSQHKPYDYGKANSSGKKDLRGFISGDIVRPLYDCVGFVYSRKKDEADVVEKYVAVPMDARLHVIGTTSEKCLVEFVKKDSVGLLFDAPFYVWNEYMEYVSHPSTTLPPNQSKK